MRPVVAGNWKMHHGPAAAREFARDLAALGIPEGVEAVVFPPAASMAAFAEACPPGVETGSQSVMWEEKGAYTGETSPAMARECGATWALAGHSERRSLFGEGDEESARRFCSALRAGMTAVLCVGETSQERAAGETAAALARQLAPAAESFGEGRALVAYEPVWAIGSGDPATPADAAEGAAACRDALGRDVPVLYGGSVSPDNLASYLDSGAIQGALVGGASLTAAGFRALLAAAA